MAYMTNPVYNIAATVLPINRIFKCWGFKNHKLNHKHDHKRINGGIIINIHFWIVVILYIESLNVKYNRNNNINKIHHRDQSKKVFHRIPPKVQSVYPLVWPVSSSMPPTQTLYKQYRWGKCSTNNTKSCIVDLLSLIKPSSSSFPFLVQPTPNQQTFLLFNHNQR